VGQMGQDVRSGEIENTQNFLLLTLRGKGILVDLGLLEMLKDNVMKWTQKLQFQLPSAQ